MVNGYKIIKIGKNLLTTAVTLPVIPGIYEAIESAVKPIMLTELAVDGVDLKPTFVAPMIVGDDFEIVVGCEVDGTTGIATYTVLTIDGDDKVAVSERTYTPPKVQTVKTVANTVRKGDVK